MAEAVLVSAFVGVAIDKVITQILHHIGIAIRYKEELSSLHSLVRDIQPIIKEIQRCRPALNRKTGIPTSQCYKKASAVNIWLKKMDLLLRQASQMVHQCTLPRYTIISRYLTSRRITRVISDIKNHLELSRVVELAQIPELLEEQTQVLLEGFGQIMKESVEALASSSSSSATTSQSLASTGFFIPEIPIVGQDTAFATLKKFVIDSEFSRIGVLGKGGSGKTLLLKRIFNSEKVRNVFSDGLLLWLTVSQFPSIKSLGKELCKQMAIQTNDRNPEGEKIWMKQTMQAKKFVLFLDDVWGKGAQLLEELGVPSLTDHSTSKIIVSSRDGRALREIGIYAESSTIKMVDLTEDESWRLFGHYAFPYNNKILPARIEDSTARAVCRKCGGLPLKIKVVGRSMAGITDQKEWEFAVRRLSNANSQHLRQDLYDPLRLSYDALGRYDVNLQLCFLYLSAFAEDEIIPTEWAIFLFIGEGLLARKTVQDERIHDPFEVGRIYINFLADSCLIEPTLRDMDGCVVRFRVHDILRDLAIQIAEQEENFYCGTGKNLTELTENECSERTRFLLSWNDLSSFPKSFRSPEISSLILAGNVYLTEIPRKVIGSMVSLKVLDLSATSIQSLPDSVGCLKQLVSLLLRAVPIRRLPASVTDLSSLEVLDVSGSKITELPSDINKLRSLTYLGLRWCGYLQSLPRSLPLLTSLKYLLMNGCTAVWTKCAQKKRGKTVACINDLQTLTQLKLLQLDNNAVACINDLQTLTQLKLLQLDNNGEIISEGTLGNMKQIETLQLKCLTMESLPDDIFKMSKLRSLWLECPSVVKLETKFYEFRSLTVLRLCKCHMLEELPDLQKLTSLRKLEIEKFSKLKKFSQKFGERGAFPLLEIFVLIKLKELEELPMIEEGAMSSLQILTIMLCKKLHILPEYCLNMEKLQKIRIWGCSNILKNLEKVKGTDTAGKIMTMTETDVIEKRREIKYQRPPFKSEYWCNEFSQFIVERISLKFFPR